MAAVLTVVPPEGNEVRIGRLPQFHVQLPSAAGHGGTAKRPIELSFGRELGGQADDSADELFFKLQAGNGRGEVTKFTAKINVRDSANQPVADLTFEGASVLSLHEVDDHPAPWSDLIIVAERLLYAPANGEPIEY
jgi:hypothetical protein